MRKIGILCLILVIALGSLGVAYARWSDTVLISGTVNTGNVDINVIDYSGTWVYKVPGGPDNETWIYNGPVTVPFQPPAGSFEVAHAVALPAGEDEVFMEFVNLFPCIDFEADILMSYDGSIPVKVSVADLAVDITKADGTKAVLGQDVDVSIVFETDGEPVPACYQLHEGDELYAAVIIHVLQTDADPNLDMMGASGTITGTIEVAQWNEDCGGGGAFPEECAPATCSTFIPCNEGGNCGSDGVCASVAEGGGVCVYGPTPCAVLTQCPGGTAECGTGEVCAVNSCCGVPVCVPGPAPYNFLCFPPGDGITSSSVPPSSGSGPTVGE
jgi:hypothetical protein